MAFFGGKLFPATLWIFLFYLYFLSRWRLLAVFVAAVFALNIFHYVIYALVLWHQGVLLSLLIALIWIDRQYDADMLTVNLRAGSWLLFYRRRIFPYLFVFFLAMQMMVGLRAAWDEMRTPFSAAKLVAERIEANPAWKDAIIIGEPDYLLESLPYYVDNPIYFVRGGRYGQWTVFSHEFKDNLSLGELLNTARQLHSSTGKPVLIAFIAGLARLEEEGKYANGYTRIFTWTKAEHRRLAAETKFVATFTGALTDEEYDVYELR